LETVALGFVRASADPGAARGVGADLVYVEYLVRDQSLIRRTRRALDPLPDTVMSERVLLSGLSNPRMQFYDGVRWLDAWTGLQSAAAPRAIAFEAQTPVHGVIRISAEVGGR
jgi:hypothetical protein